MMPMNFSTTIPLRTGSETSATWRLAISLTIALGVHAALITLPVSLAPLVPGAATGNETPLKITLSSGKHTEVSPVLDEYPSIPPKPRKLERRSAEKSNKKVGAEQPPSPSRPDTEAQGKSTPKPEFPSKVSPRPMEIPADAGAKSRSTVFDPELEKKLARARNRVRKFKSRDVSYMTTTGTFVRQGGRCWEIKRLSPAETSSEPSHWFRIKCPQTSSRPQSDIDRLAEKYGVP